MKLQWGLYSDRFREVSREVDVDAVHDGEMVTQEL